MLLNAAVIDNMSVPSPPSMVSMPELVSIEGCLETLMNARFCVLKIDFAPPFVPPVIGDRSSVSPDRLICSNH